MADDGETMRVVIRVRPRLPGEENDGTAGSATAVRISKGAKAAGTTSATTAANATSTTSASAAADAANAAAGIHAGASSGAGTGGPGREDTLNISTAKHNISCRFDDVLESSRSRANRTTCVRGGERVRAYPCCTA